MNLNIKNSGKFLLAGVALIAQGCLNDFQEINTNQQNPTAAQKNLDGVAAGGYFTDFQKRVVPTRSNGEGTDRPNEYQVAFNLAADNWAGYMSPMANKFNNGNNFTTNFMIKGWVNYTYQTMFTNIMNPWIQIKQQTHRVEMVDGKPVFHKKDLLNQANFAIAQIIKIQALHKTTDMFGPLPYKGISSGNLYVAYDSQEDIYKSFFEELDKAVKTLSEYSQINDKILEDFDGVYHGDVNKWMKLGNSLMLRLAMRVKYVDPELCRKYANKAINNPGGLIEKTDDIAMLKTGNLFNYLNSIHLLWDAYNDCRMGATILSYLNGFNDPRLPAYFRQGSTEASGPKQYLAVRTGVPQQDNVNFYTTYSVPNIEDDTPTYWFKASEVLFLKAEAALDNIISGDAKTFYEDGVKMSFAENNVNIGNYLETGGSADQYVDPKNTKYNASAPSSLSKKWDDVSNNEEHLEQIITQKYIAIYPDGQEAWSEWRRTGYPKQIPAYLNKTNAGVIKSDGHKNGVRRFPFPQSELDENTANVTKAIGLLNGPNNSATHLWWDANPNLK
ncbi:SusD/RagB family nutrient-binding outer membrane lipoprotein [Ornithobacterium rhinotracheale]|uniref:RagB/SusD family nutrient uptake outer membrane protein n=1 Tax=Ornithobacterium rhinotracheale TaxID=28251 RepID=UPI00129C7E55|nr:RagB/SusD family nutrient uptake outer membrane protein [Ornithobacterium rhinotracheale]MRI64473.1 SusD/RagB family nutrient-binding outer membrane lipoprotein [Ornithobacterium rhinotracheale]